MGGLEDRPALKNGVRLKLPLLLLPDAVLDVTPSDFRHVAM